MSYTLVAILTCQDPHPRKQTFVSKSNLPERARSQAEKTGWSFQRDRPTGRLARFVDLCPACTLKRKELLARVAVRKEGTSP